jgi:hypothetical protein
MVNSGYIVAASRGFRARCQHAPSSLAPLSPGCQSDLPGRISAPRFQALRGTSSTLVNPRQPSSACTWQGSTGRSTAACLTPPSYGIVPDGQACSGHQGHHSHQGSETLVSFRSGLPARPPSLSPFCLFSEAKWMAAPAPLPISPRDSTLLKCYPLLGLLYIQRQQGSLGCVLASPCPCACPRDP